ncbi:hypothetical protein JCM11641_006937 [Rhodosporidiobolus odoratus]
MQLSLSATLATLTAAALVVAQTSSTGTASASASSTSASTSAIPSCALQCTLSSLTGTECESYGVSNVTCICTSSSFQLAYYNCQQTACSPSDLSAAEAYGAQICEENGTPIDISATPSGYTGPARSTGSAANQTVSSSISSTASASTSAKVSSISATGSAPSASATGGTSGAGQALDKNLIAGWTAVLAGGVALIAGAW